VRFLVTRSATLQGWHSRSLGSKPISQRHYYYFSCRKSSTLFCLALNCSASCLVQDIEYQGVNNLQRLTIFTDTMKFHRFNPDTNLLHPSKALFQNPPKKMTTLVLRTLSMLGLTNITIHPTTGNILEANNLTILNLLLLWLGPMNEKRLVRVLMCVQVSIFVWRRALHISSIYAVAVN
jgi:hypothetical protein